MPATPSVEADEPAPCSVPGCTEASTAECPCRRSRLCSWHAIGARLSDGCVCRGPCTVAGCDRYATCRCDLCDGLRCPDHAVTTVAYGLETTACRSTMPERPSWRAVSLCEECGS